MRPQRPASPRHGDRPPRSRRRTRHRMQGQRRHQRRRQQRAGGLPEQQRVALIERHAGGAVSAARMAPRSSSKMNSNTSWKRSSGLAGARSLGGASSRHRGADCQLKHRPWLASASQATGLIGTLVAGRARKKIRRHIARRSGRTLRGQFLQRGLHKRQPRDTEGRRAQ